MYFQGFLYYSNFAEVVLYNDKGGRYGQNDCYCYGSIRGLGREFVKILSKEKKLSEIWVVARNAQKLQQLAEEFGTKIRPIAKDLSDNVQRKELSAMIAEERAAIQYLINNAGYAKFCSYDDLSVEESINMINLNISAVVALGLYCIPYMKPGSHIINIASQASFQPLPYQIFTVLPKLLSAIIHEH